MAIWKIHGVVLSLDQSQIVSTNWEVVLSNGSSMGSANVSPQALNTSEADLVAATKDALGLDQVMVLETEPDTSTDNLHRAFPILTATQDAARIARNKRNALIEETDFYALSDVTMSDGMSAYRTALRDVPQQNGFPDSITWPTKP
ncbi:phage tail assembly chaperone [Rhodobacteraceae bacterium]|nr:phage tail assembly chaperone [Paracoccaceae bacterium]